MDQSIHYLQEQIDSLKYQIQENQALLSDPSMKELAQQEITRLEGQITALEDSLNQDTSKEDQDADNPFEKSPATIEIRGAAGGDEAKIFASDLENMYTRFATNLGFKIEFLDGGVFKVSGKPTAPWELYPFETFKHEAGVHRVQRVPATESAGRIHTSTSTVAVLPEVKTHQVEVKESEIVWEFIRAGGPGGQNVNKLSTAVRLTYKPTGDVIVVRTERYQQRNKEIAIELLRQKLWAAEQEKTSQQIGSARSAIGTGDRSEKIRTYNYPQNRVTDHRINKSWYALDRIVGGDLKDVILTTREQLSHPEEV